MKEFNPIFDQSVRKTISPSRLQTFQRCSLQYWYAYVRKLKKPIKISLVLGNSVHKGLEENNKYKSITSKDMKVNSILELYSEEYENQFKSEEIDLENENKSVIKDSGVNVIKEYHSTTAPQIQPDAKVIETYFRIPLKGVDYDILGKIDLADKSKYVIDYKTGRRKKSLNEFVSNIQFPIYNLGYKKLTGEYPLGAKVCQLTALKTETKVSLKELPQEQMWQYNVLAKMIMGVKIAIDKNAFYPCNNPMVCSWCGYSDLCKKGDW